jgi:hypothetical protein
VDYHFKTAWPGSRKASRGHLITDCSGGQGLLIGGSVIRLMLIVEFFGDPQAAKTVRNRRKQTEQISDG